MALINPSPGSPKSKRYWYRQHILLPTGTGSTLESYVIGRDNTSLSADVTWEETDELNVLNEMTSNNILSAVTIPVDPYFLRDNDELTDLIKELYFSRADGDDLRVKFGEVYIAEGDTTSSDANTQDAVLLYNSFGGESSDGVNVPFTIKLIGKPTRTTFTLATETYG